MVAMETGGLPLCHYLVSTRIINSPVFRGQVLLCSLRFTCDKTGRVLRDLKLKTLVWASSPFPKYLIITAWRRLHGEATEPEPRFLRSYCPCRNHVLLSRNLQSIQGALQHIHLERVMRLV